MPPDLKDQAHLADMVVSARLVMGYVRGKTRSDYDRDSLPCGRVERRLAIIGEAATRVSAACRGAMPHVPRRKIIGSRNIVTHNYDEVDSEHLPDLVMQLEAVLPPPPADDQQT